MMQDRETSHGFSGRFRLGCKNHGFGFFRSIPRGGKMKNNLRLFGLLAFMAVFLGPVAYAEELEKATFAGGCFWCMEPAFEQTPGVAKVTAGYIGGSGKNPTYETYASAGYVEGIEIVYDPAKVSYSQLLAIFWKQIDPTDPGGQFGDRGPQYRSIIFYQNRQQKRLSEMSKDALKKSGHYSKSIITEILPATDFYEAEAAHQSFYLKNPLEYKLYRARAGRN
jgi:methionine-S-sulfoxide reductase